MKKIINIILSLLIIISSFFISFHYTYATQEFDYKELSKTTIEITQYHGYDKDIIVPSTINNMKIVNIGENAFANNQNVRSVVLPDTVENIKKNAFLNCKNMESVEMSKNLIYIGENAFQNCLSLSKINLENKVQSIGSHAFDSCRNLSQLKIPNSVISIESYAFYYCTGIEDMVIPNSVKKIGKACFSYCRELKSISLSNNITTLMEESFSFCDHLITVKLPDHLNEIQDNVFSYCSKLTQITIPNQLKTIGYRAFVHCHSLKNILISKSVQLIDQTAFDDCINLEKILVHKENKYFYSDGIALYSYNRQTLLKVPCKVNSFSIPLSVTKVEDGAFYSCQSLKEIFIPKTVTSIGCDAFVNCQKLNQITLSDAITTINKNTFRNCSQLSNIVLPKNLKRIEDQAFSHCSSLVNLTIPSSLTYIAPDAFANCTNLNLTVYSNTYALKYVQKHNYKHTIIGSITKVTLNKTHLTLKKNEIFTLMATIAPNDTTDDKTLSWSSNKTNVATVDNKGVVKAIGEGTAIITVQTSNKKIASCVVDVQMSKKSMNKLNINVSNLYYTGSNIKPTVTIKDGNKTLKNKTDYTLSYTKASKVGATIKITIKGNGNYIGTVTKSVKIIKKPINKLTIKGIPNTKVYTGKAIKPSITVYNGNKKLKNKTDYTVSYGTNKSTGKATIKIVGKGNYNSSLTKTFYIVPKAPASLKLTASKKSIKVSYKKSIGASGYQIAYSTKKTSGFKFVTTTAKSKTLCKLTSKKTYYIKVRAYKIVNGKKYYSSYTSIKKVRVK